MYSAAAVANAMLDIASKNGEHLTHMKLQKLVYISHGWSLVLHDSGLFYDEIRAWQYGPVIPTLYESLRHNGGRPIYEPVPLLPRQAKLEEGTKEMALLRGIWRSYGKHSATRLSSITHQDNTPWSKTWIETPYGPIKDDVIREHYLILNERRKARLQQPA